MFENGFRNNITQKENAQDEELVVENQVDRNENLSLLIEEMQWDVLKNLFIYIYIYIAALILPDLFQMAMHYQCLTLKIWKNYQIG